MNEPYILLDDQITENNGGTSLTTCSITEDRESRVIRISPSQLSPEVIARFRSNLWIIGNFMSAMSLSEDIVSSLFNSVKFVKIEFDYNFCSLRGELPHEILAGRKCECPHGMTGNKALAKSYDLIIKKAEHIFFMSERQRAVYSNHLPLLNFSKTCILSSCFSKKSFSTFKSLKNREKNGRYAVLEGYGGWHSKAKGLDEAKKFCEVNHIKYDVIPNQSHESYIETLSQYKGLVFLPIIDDTCPRCIIEARLLGLDIITNINCQHTNEWWWNDERETEQYLKQRPSFFWATIDSITNKHKEVE